MPPRSPLELWAAGRRGYSESPHSPLAAAPEGALATSLRQPMPDSGLRLALGVLGMDASRGTRLRQRTNPEFFGEAIRAC